MPKTKEGGYIIDDRSAAIGFDPLKEIRPPSKKEEKQLAKKREGSPTG